MEKEYVIRKFEDLLNLLRERPDYFENLRILLLTRELLELIEMFEEFRSEMNKRFDEVNSRLESLEKGQSQHEEN
ncbi:MAG: hypothetical protein ABIL76_00325, partial [candidate division WOR-3 bacterium]